MTIEIKVPVLPESVTDATVSKWYKKEGDTIRRDENLVDLETDKVMLEVPAPKEGVIQRIEVPEGTVVTADQVLAIISDEAVAPAAKPAAPAKSAPSTPAPQAVPAKAGPAVRREAAQKGVDVAQVQGSGKEGRVTKQDVQQAAKTAANVHVTPAPQAVGQRHERRVRMTRLREKIAERLLASQQSAAILTTFNEVDMQPVMALRARYKDQFEKQNGVRLGFMSFFVKAVVEALKRFPEVNAYIDGQDVVYHDYYDVGIAIGSPRGLVVPIIRNAEMLSMAEVEKTIRAYAERANAGKLTMEDMTGGTFTISNGGTYGSMMSTPIINPPQSAILGMHKIMERPMVENGQIVVRPMMYLALSYDHRIIDGAQSVRFLVTIKEMLEDPARLILQV